MTYKIAEYPQGKYRFRLYDNKEGLSWQEVQERTGCYALVNLGYFSLKDFSVQDHIMVDGDWLAAPTWADNGILVDREGRLTVGPDKAAAWGYCRGEPCYKLHGKPVSNAGHKGKNGLTMLGVKPDGTVAVLLVSKDEGMGTREGLGLLEERGCESVLRYDGSWSSQGSLGPGMDVQPSQRRTVRSYLLIYKRESQKGDDEMKEIEKDYMARNPCYTSEKAIVPKGVMVHSTASPGQTARALRDKWDSKSADKSVHAFIDDTVTLQALPWTARAWHAGAAYKGGPTANDTHIAFEVCEPQECRLIPIEWVTLKRGSKGWAVKRLQQELVARGYDPKGVDGSFGAGCEAAVKQFQKDNGLTVDGKVGQGSLSVLSSRNGSYLKYNPLETAGYFNTVWDKAVELTAQLCTEYGLDPEKDVLCHQEGYRQKIASNHADVFHWWPLHGKSMDDFRGAVADKLNENKSSVTCPNCGYKIYT